MAPRDLGNFPKRLGGHFYRRYRQLENWSSHWLIAMAPRLALLAATVLLHSPAEWVTAAPNFYIAPSGSDAAGDGTLVAPWATLTRVQLAVRSVNANMSADVMVYLLSGDYYQSSTFELQPADSGSNGFYVRYSAYQIGAGVAPPVIHGGVPVTSGWALVNATRNIWAALVSEKVTDTRQAYINGVRMNRTATSFGLGTPTITSWGYTVTSDPFPGFFDAHQAQRDIEFLYTGVGASWTECRLRVQSVAVLPGGGVNVTMAQPGFSLGRNKYFGQGVTAPVGVSNLYSLMHVPGDSYFNSDTKTLYYIPRPGDDLSTAVVMLPGAAEVLVRLQGDTSTPAVTPVKFVAFEGLTFSYAGWLEPNTGVGYVDMQSGFRVLPTTSSDDSSWTPVPGNIQMHTVENVSVTGEWARGRLRYAHAKRSSSS